MEDLRRVRQHLQSFLLRHGRVFTGREAWTKAHTRWLCEQRFEHPAQYLVLAEYRQAIEAAEIRLKHLDEQVAETVSSWSMAPVIAAYQALRGVAFLTAVTFVAEIGDVRRFDSPRQPMAYLGLVPCENSTAERIRRGSITKAGNGRARRVLIEGAWTYRFPAPDEPPTAGAAGRPDESGVRHRLESPSQTLRSLSQADGTWQTPGSRHRGHRPGNGRLSLGNRPKGGAARRNLIACRISHAFLPPQHRKTLRSDVIVAHRWGQGLGRGTLAPIVWPTLSMPAGRSRQPPDEQTEMRYPTRVSESANRRLSGFASCVA